MIKRKYILISAVILIIFATTFLILSSGPKFCLENINLGKSLDEDKIPNKQGGHEELFIDFEEFRNSAVTPPKFVIWDDLKNNLFYVIDRTFPTAYQWYGPFGGEPYKILRCPLSHSLPFLNKPKKEDTLTETCLKQKEPDLICTQILVRKGLISPSACETIETGYEKEKGACYYAGALKTNNISICDKISDSERQATCKTVLTKDPELCNTLVSKGILGDYFVNLCFEDLAKINNDLSLCDHFKGNDYKYTDCYQGVATYFDNVSICEKLGDKNSVTQCKFQFNNLKKSY